MADPTPLQNYEVSSGWSYRTMEWVLADPTELWSEFWLTLQNYCVSSGWPYRTMEWVLADPRELLSEFWLAL